MAPWSPTSAAAWSVALLLCPLNAPCGCLISCRVHMRAHAQTHEIDAALTTLATLVERDARGVGVYVVFVKVRLGRVDPYDDRPLTPGVVVVQGILDHLDDLSLNQVRTLFHIFSTLAHAVRPRMAWREDPAADAAQRAGS